MAALALSHYVLQRLDFLCKAQAQDADGWMGVTHLFILVTAVLMSAASVYLSKVGIDLVCQAGSVAAHLSCELKDWMEKAVLKISFKKIYHGKTHIPWH